MSFRCHTVYGAPGEYYRDHHRVFITVGGQLTYRLTAFGEDSAPLRALYSWICENHVGCWSRDGSAFLFEDGRDAFAFMMRWNGAEIGEPD